MHLLPEWDAVMWALQQLQWNTLWGVFHFSQPKLRLWAPTKHCFALSSSCTVCVAACRRPNVPLLLDTCLQRNKTSIQNVLLKYHLLYDHLCSVTSPNPFLPHASKAASLLLTGLLGLGWGQARKPDVNIEFGVKSEFDTAHLWLGLGH